MKCISFNWVTIVKKQYIILLFLLYNAISININIKVVVTDSTIYYIELNIMTYLKFKRLLIFNYYLLIDQ